MDVDQFWEIIDAVKQESGGDIDNRPEILAERLSALSPDEIHQFDVLYFEHILQAYRWELWGAAYVINGGCSDDGFRYFCDWLISEGRSTFEKALDDPESLAELDDISDLALEEFGYVAMEVYEDKTGEELPDSEARYPDEPAGDEWPEDQVEQYYPRLAEKYA